MIAVSKTKESEAKKDEQIIRFIHSSLLYGRMMASPEPVIYFTITHRMPQLRAVIQARRNITYAGSRIVSLGSLSKLDFYSFIVVWHTVA